MKTLLTLAVLAVVAPQLAAQKKGETEIEKLEREASELQKQVEEALKLAEAKARVAKLKQELADAKKGKLPPRKATKKTPKKSALVPEHVDIMPRWRPNLKQWEMTLLKDSKGVWWIYQCRGGFCWNFYSYDPGQERVAREFAMKQTTYFKWVTAEELAARNKKRP